MSLRGIRALIAMTALIAALTSGACLAAPGLRDVGVPPEPPVPPTITYPVDLDGDLDHVDDALTERIAHILAEARTVSDSSDRAKRLEQLHEPVGVELLFSQRISPSDLDAFEALGGIVDHVFRHVSYGWGGRIPLEAVRRLPAAMGPSFLAVLMSRPVSADMDEATRTGRVRPVWAAGFAGAPSGFTGSATTAIAFLDTGIDGSHTDLAGRMLYWKDWYNSEPSPVDYDGHGTMAAGVALASGAAAGASPSVLRFTDSADLSSTSSGSFKPWPMHLPPGSATLDLSAAFLGGGQATLGYAYSDNGVVSYSLGSPTKSGKTPLAVTCSFTATSSRRYSTYLTKKTSADSVTLFAVSGAATYAGVGDGFNALSGVAPGCYWIGHKVYANDGTGGDTSTIGYALDECIAYNASYNIKVVNVSLSTDTAHSPTRNKVNTCVGNGMVVTVSAGNKGPTGVMTDPARARLAITAAASSDANALTVYSSIGDFSQELNTDYKPDLCPPGGSKYHTNIMSADANQSDAGSRTFPDQYPNDYTNLQGTSMSAPFAAGAAALVIQALESRGLSWSYGGDAHPRLVKMLLCATATETNAGREGGVNSPTLGRATAPRDMYEGYGVINCDAAVEAACLSMSAGETIMGDTAGGPFDRRAWARSVQLTGGVQLDLTLAVPDTADFDLYLYSGEPDANGNPIILSAGAHAGNGVDEAISYTPAAGGAAYVVVKRISGAGSWTLDGGKADTTLYAVDRTGTVTESVALRQYDLKRTGDNSLLEGKTITYRVDGTEVGSAVTDAGGDSSLNWVITDGPAARVIGVAFEGDGSNNPSSANAALTCLSWATKMVLFDRTARITDRTELKARLLRSDNVPLYNKSINFYVDGTFIITRPTNVDGYASYPFYDVPDGAGAGVRTILSEWPGDGGYAAVSKTATLTVLKAIPYIWVLPKTVPQGSIANLYAYFRRLYDYQKQEGKTVDFKLDGTVIQTVVTGSGDQGGVARYLYPTTEPAGVYRIRCEFYGDAWLEAGYGEADLTIY